MAISNLLLFAVIFISTNYISLFRNAVRGDGMLEVFRWRQMDYYNRGDNLNSLQPNIGDRQGQKVNKGGAIVFPNQRPNYAGRRKRTADRSTSRNEFVGITSRWGSSYAGRPRPYSISPATPATTNTVSDSSSYIPYNNVPMGVTHDSATKRLFVTMPRRRVGIPSTLNYIDMRGEGSVESPKLYAYPNFETNYLNPHNFAVNPDRIISVYRTTIDECRRLWFVDTGMLEYPNNRTQVQRPSIWIIDLRTDRLLLRFDIPENIVSTGQGLASITVDVTPGQCSSAYAYLPDLVNDRLFVFSPSENRMWAFSHNYFNFDPIAGDLNIGGQQFRWDDGIFSVTLGPIVYGQRDVYFHPMASNNEFYVSNSVLKNSTNAQRSDHGSDFKILGSRGEQKQSTMHEYDPRTETIFYAEIQRNGVGCWNTRKIFSPQSHGTVFSDAQRMIYPSDLTIDSEGTIWVMSNSMPIFIYSELDPNTFNFRIWKQKTSEAVKNTVCAR